MTISRTRVSSSLLCGAVAALLGNVLKVSCALGAEMTNVLKLEETIQPRLFLDEFLLPANAAQHDLLIQGWQAVNDRPANDPLGTWALNTIHATPVEPYDGVLNPAVQNQANPGYCLHNTIAFGAWHRLHTALFEHRVRQEAEEIAETYPDELRAEYQEAAKTLRLPIFDWANKNVAESGYPAFFQDETIVLYRHVNGTTNVEVSNPFHSYKFPIETIGIPQAPEGPPPLRRLAEVPLGNPLAYAANESSTRYPLGDGLPLSQTGNKAAADETIRDVSYNCAQPTLYKLLNKRDTTMNCMINEIDPCCTDEEHEVSLERVHGYAHNMLGGSALVGYKYSGTLSQLTPLQAFDPIFYFLHVTMDFYLAMWQALNVDKKLEPAQDYFGSFVANPGLIDSNSPMYPFWKGEKVANFDDATWLTPEETRDYKVLGYSYSVIDDGTYQEEDLLAFIEENYGAVTELDQCKYLYPLGGVTLDVPPPYNETEPVCPTPAPETESAKSGTSGGSTKSSKSGTSGGSMKSSKSMKSTSSSF